jgi:DNA-directed RNA polymerase specialized sigma24 family protein
MTPQAATHPRGTILRVDSPTLTACAQAHDQAAELRARLAEAERDYHHLVLAAYNEGSTAQQIADAVGTTRAPIYKRINRAKQGGDYGARPAA